MRFLRALCAAVGPRLFYPLACRPVPKRAAAEHFVYNHARDVSRVPVRSQRAPGVAQMRYARTHCGETGCGAVAVYNALTALGLAVSLAEIVYQMERRAFAACGGRLGSHPFRLEKVLTLYPVRVRRIGRTDTLTAAMRTGDTAILVIWNDRERLRSGAHFFAIQRTAAEYTAYNREGVAESGTLPEILGRGQLITAYLVQTLV